MRIQFHRLAEAEFDEAVSYYEQCQQGLGITFAEEIFATIGRIVEFPSARSPTSKNTRRCLANRFPYGVIYQIKTDSVHNYRDIQSEQTSWWMD